MNIFKKQDTESVNKFHAELTEITTSQGVTYVEAMVQYLDEAGLDYCNKETIEKYLYQKGLSKTDVHLLTSEYCMVLGLRAQG